MKARSILSLLLAVSVMGPLAVLVLFGVGRLLTAMGDEPGGLMMWRVGWMGVVVLLINGFGLVVVLAADALMRDRDPPEDRQP